MALNYGEAIQCDQLNNTYAHPLTTYFQAGFKPIFVLPHSGSVPALQPIRRETVSGHEGHADWNFVAGASARGAIERNRLFESTFVVHPPIHLQVVGAGEGFCSELDWRGQ